MRRRRCCLASYMAVSATCSAPSRSVPVLRTAAPIEAATSKESSESARRRTSALTPVVVRVDGQHRELVTAEPGRDVVSAHHRLDRRRAAARELVPGAMALAVVDFLEPVEIDRHDSPAGVRRRQPPRSRAGSSTRAGCRGRSARRSSRPGGGARPPAPPPPRAAPARGCRPAGSRAAPPARAARASHRDARSASIAQSVPKSAPSGAAQRRADVGANLGLAGAGRVAIGGYIAEHRREPRARTLGPCARRESRSSGTRRRRDLDAVRLAREHDPSSSATRVAAQSPMSSWSWS